MGSIFTTTLTMFFQLVFFCLASFTWSSPINFPSVKTLERVPNPCLTLSGTRCVFPFKYQGVEYYRCTFDDSPVPWCATSVDSNGTVVTNSWGDCDNTALSSCPADSISTPSCTTSGGPKDNTACVFPFRYLGVIYNSCATTSDKENAWCSTNTTKAGEHIEGHYGFCPLSCPGAEDNTPTTTASSTVTTSTAASSSSSASISTTSSNESRLQSNCRVISGPANDKQCVFPFVFSGTTYTGCAEWIYGGPDTGKWWCSTKTDNKGEHVNGEGEYGICEETCPKSQGFDF